MQRGSNPKPVYDNCRRIKGVFRCQTDERLLRVGHQFSKNVLQFFFFKLTLSSQGKRQKRSFIPEKEENDQTALRWLPSEATPTAFWLELE